MPLRPAEIARNERGFTLIELLIALVILAVLLAIAVPSLLGFSTRGSDGAAKANVRAALPAIETYFSTNDTYVGMNVAALQAIDSSVALDPLAAAKQTATSYCISATVGGRTWYKAGPSADISSSAC